MTLDVIVRGGLVIDGTGGAAYRADVGIQGNRIAAVGNLDNVRGERELDASGRIVAPGFIDIHSHSDFTVLIDPRAQSSIAQGVTTEIVGNCGHGCAPISDPAIVTGNIYGYNPELPIRWRSVGQYLDAVDRARTGVNIATLVPNGNLRIAVMGLEDRQSDPQEMCAMRSLLEQGLEEGAFGVSTGLEYPTERATTEQEIVDMCRITCRHAGIYATHTRNRDSDAIAAIEEALRAARRSGCPLQISHIIPRRAGPTPTEETTSAWVQALEIVDAARESGDDVSFDAHTRLHGTTNLSTALPPDVSRLRGEALVWALRDADVRDRVRSHPSIVASFGLGGWKHVSLFSCRTHPEWVGRSFPELAPEGGDAFDAILEVLSAEADDPHYPLCLCHSYEEEWLRYTMRHPLCTVGSDATALCPDGPLAASSFLGAYTWAGWFARTLVREHGDLTWEEAVHKLTAMPADRVGLAGRGRLREGGFADVVAFDPERFRDRGTLEQPNVLAEGMDHVIVNGVVTLERGAFTGERGGRALRKA